MEIDTIQLLHDIKKVPLSRQERTTLSLKLTESLLQSALSIRSKAVKKKEEWVGRVMNDTTGRQLLTEIADLTYRSLSPNRSIDQLISRLQSEKIPKSLPESDQLKLLLLSNLGHLFPKFFLSQIHSQLQKSLKGILLYEPAEDQKTFFREARKKHYRVNLNHLGEAILGEKEAESRIQRYLNDLQEDEVDYISVKASTLYSQIQLTAWEETLEHLSKQLKRLYIQKKPHQFVNLDMEEFKDLDLTVELFKRVLSEPDFQNLYAGLALQAYLPDSYPILIELTEWAKKRGSPIRVRLVKGANLPMEKIEASLNNWTQAPYHNKCESDANFKRMLEYALTPENIQHVHIGIGSHNLFDIAYALVLQHERGIESGVEFEMLSGMATTLQQVICELTGNLTLYCPKSSIDDFQHAISYLIRRFDENSAPGHFLKHYFKLTPGHSFWNEEVERFTASVEKIDHVGTTTNRASGTAFHSPPIDFALAKNRERLKKIYLPPESCDIPLMINGEELKGTMASGSDPSTRKSFYTYQLASTEQLDLAFQASSFEISYEVYKAASSLLDERRDEWLSYLIADGGKTVFEGDHEISEAIDFINYYSEQESLAGAPRGFILVAPPWNFPLAIPLGGIMAALVTGNHVLFKPAPETTYLGWKIASLLWEAGVPKEALQFIPYDTSNPHLLKHPQLSGVILTGATETAEKMLTMRPDLYLMAETGGKNSIIVTAMADRDLAVRDLVSSAFGHAGQKCSACSLAILEKEVYEDQSFLNQLQDATTSLFVGSAWDPKTKVNPLIRPPNEKLIRALTTLDEGESWLVEPRQLEDNLWTPGIKLGVRPGSFFHQTECFGPVLGVMIAEDLGEAIDLANATAYGLTSGLHSLDPREQETWKEQIEAGNLYINRNITGAIVGRQPFGGCKASSFGPGKKAGGPHYCNQLVHLEAIAPSENAPIPESIITLLPYLNQLNDEERSEWKKSIESYAYWAKEYQQTTELAHLLGQKNLYYMVPKKTVTLRYEDEPLVDLLKAIGACLICKTPYIISSVKPLDIECSVEAFCEEREVRRVRDVFSSGKLEIPYYLREISLSFDYHRYGYVGDERQT